jgi:hypothetical protein
MMSADQACGVVADHKIDCPGVCRRTVIHLSSCVPMDLADLGSTAQVVSRLTTAEGSTDVRWVRASRQMLAARPTRCRCVHEQLSPIGVVSPNTVGLM